MTNKEIISKINEKLYQMKEEYDKTQVRDELGFARVYGMLEVLTMIDPKDYVILNMRVAYRDSDHGPYHDAYVNA